MTHLTHFRVPLLSACLAAITAPALAVDWDGDAGTTDFNDPINWTDDALPGTGAGIENAVIGNANTAVVDLAGPLSVSPIGDLRVGQSFFGNGTLNHSSGALVTADDKWSFVGVDGDGLDPSVGVYNLSGDALFEQTRVAFADSNHFHLGLGGGRRSEGADLPNTGEINIQDTAQMNLNNFFVGSNDDNVGRVNQSGDSAIFAENWVSIGREAGARGYYNMTGGQLAVTQDGITVGESSGAYGEMNLSGDADVDAGRLRVGRSLALDAETGAGGTGLLTVSGHEVDLRVGFLDIGSNDGANTNGEGTLSFTASESGISTLKVIESVNLNDGSVEGFAALDLDLSLAPAGDLTLIEIEEALGATTGTFMGLAEGAMVPDSGGRTITYVGGDGNDIVLLDDAVAPIFGDFEPDGDVDIIDFGVFADAFGSVTGDAEYNADADSEPDGDVDIIDFGLFADNFGIGVPATAVPEPTSLVALLCGLIAAPVVGRRR